MLVLLICLTSLPSILFEQDTLHALSVYRDLTIPLFFFVGFLLVGLDRKQVLRLVKLFVLLAAANALLGIGQYITGNYLWLVSPAGKYAMYHKITLRGVQSSTFGQFLGVKDTLATGLYAGSNNFAAYLVMPTVLASVFAVLPGLRNRERLFWQVSCLVLFLALLFTFSRGSLLTFMIAWALLMWFRKKRRVSARRLIVVGSLAVLLALLIIASGIISWDSLLTVTGRMTMLKSALALLRDHPEALITGGFTEDYLLYYYHFQVVHNLVLYMILQFGLLTLSIWLLLVMFALRYIAGVIRAEDKELKHLSLALVSGLAAIVFLYEQTSNSIMSVQDPLLIFFWLGVGIYLYRFYRTESPGQTIETRQLLDMKRTIPDRA
jgi:O-antigen ligase